MFRYTDKPLLGDFTCRQQDGLENLIKLSGLLGAVWKNKQVANKIGVRLLMMVRSHIVSPLFFLHPFLRFYVTFFREFCLHNSIGHSI